MRPRIEPAALFALALLTIIWAWWATKEGAYFAVVLLPGTIILCIGTALLGLFAPWRARLALSRPTAAALAALAGLAIWSLISALWSPAPDIAIQDAQRIFVYALAFGLGLWLCNLLGMRMELAVVPVVAAAAFASLVAIVALATINAPRDLFEIDGTLDYPLGYRNANAAFFAIAFFPALGLAMRRELDWRLRGACVATAVVGLDLAVFSQSRASVPAFALALLAYLLLSPYRVRALSWLGLAVIPAALFAPAIGDVYTAVNDDGLSSALDEINRAGILLAVVAVVALGLGAAGARFESRLPGLRAANERSNRGVAIAIAVVTGICAVGFVAAVGDPVDWIGQKADEFKSSGTPDSSESSSRFSFNAGSNRYDLWRVALDDFADHPLRGDGGGGYPYSYVEKRDVAYQTARDAHSVELELLGELGLPGLALLVVVVVGAALGAARARRLGPSAAGLVAVCGASGTYWFAHTSIDWFWPYPAVTAPAMMLLGAACGPAVLALESDRPVWWRPWLVTGLVVLALSAIPLWLSERYVNSASQGWQVDPGQAFADLGTAQDLNPFSDWPILVEGEIARQAGDDQRAIDAFMRAAAKRPEEYAGFYRLAELTREDNPAFAREQISRALALNPLDAKVQALAERLGVPVSE